MQGRFKCEGVKRFQGNLDGVNYDQTKALLIVPFPKNSENLGNDVIAVQLGDKASGKIFENLKFPVEVELDFEISTKGMEVNSWKLVERPNVAQQPKS